MTYLSITAHADAHYYVHTGTRRCLYSFSGDHCVVPRYYVNSVSQPITQSKTNIIKYMHCSPVYCHILHLECLHMPSWHLFKMGGPGAETLISIRFHTMHGYVSMCAAYCARHLLISLIEQLGFLIFKALKADFNFARSYPARVTVRYSDEPWNGGALHEPKGGFCTR